MNPGANKRKGNAFENYVKDAIQKRCNMEITLCRKTFASGAFEDDKGDVVVGAYMIECKNYKKVTDGLINKWWDKIKEESEGGKKFPVLVNK